MVQQRARLRGSAIRRMAEAGDPACIALLPIANRLERSASALELLPAAFWALDRAQRID